MNKYVLRLPSGNKAGRAQKNVACVNRSGKTTQMYLDLGQKDFGSTQTCKLCNMLFVNDDELDFKSHEKYCKKVQYEQVLMHYFRNHCFV